MPKPLSLFIAAAIFSTPLFGQTLTPAQAREDIAFFRKKMAAWYPGIGYYQPAEVYEKNLDSLAASIAQTIDYQSFYQKIGAVRAVLQDGHFGIYHRKKRFPKDPNLLPFYIRPAEGKYWVLFDLTQDSSLRRGTEIVSIDGRPTGELHDFLTDHFRDGNDGPTESGSRARTILSFAGFWADYFGNRDSVDICSKKTDTSATQCRRIYCPKASERDAVMGKRYPARPVPQPNLTFELVDSVPRTAILYVTNFDRLRKRDLFNIGFAIKLKKNFRAARRAGIENLVIDLRNNGGGAVINSARLLRYLVPGRFDVFSGGWMKRRAIWPYTLKGGPPPFNFLFFFWEHKKDRATGGWCDRRHRRPAFKPHKSLIFRGQTWFLINGASYSAATTVPAVCRSHGTGLMVGEPTGGAYWGDFAARFKTITLPNSKIRVRIPLKKLDHAVNLSNNPGLLVSPDFPVERTKEDILLGRDYFVPAVMDLIKKGAAKN